MWFADFYCDSAWVASRQGVLGEKRCALKGGRSASLGIKVDTLLFGDDQKIRHVRVLMDTDDQRIAQECLNGFRCEPIANPDEASRSSNAALVCVWALSSWSKLKDKVHEEHQIYRPMRYSVFRLHSTSPVGSSAESW